MPIDVDNVIIKCFQLICDGFQTDNLVGWMAGRKLIIVQNKHQVIQLIMGRRHQSFPYLALLHLAVSGNRVYLVGISFILLHDCHTNSYGKTLAQKTCSGIHLRYIANIRMALKLRINLTES